MNEKELNIMKSEVEDLKKLLANFSSGSTNTPTDLSEIEKSLTTLENKVSELQATSSQTTSKMESLDNKVSNLDAGLTTSQTEIDSIKQQIATMKEQLNQLQSDFPTLEDNLSSTQAKVETVENTISSIEGNIGTINTKISSIEGNLTTINTNLTTTENNISSLENTLNATQENITSVSNRVSSSETKIESIENKVIELENLHSSDGESGNTPPSTGTADPTQNWITFYDKNSTDASVNLGLSSGIKGGSGNIANMPDFMPYNWVKFTYVCGDCREHFIYNITNKTNGFHTMLIIAKTGLVYYSMPVLFHSTTGKCEMEFQTARSITFLTSGTHKIATIDTNASCYIEKIEVKVNLF